MKGESKTIIWFTDKKPLFIIVEKDTGDMDDKIRIETGACQFQLEFHLSQENLKKLFIAIQERLKDGIRAASFTEDNKFISYPEEGEMIEKSAEEILKEGGI